MQQDPLWYKDAILYELHVRAFSDSNSDGIGDFRGLIGKLDYLQDLGITTIWLLPFYPSPLKDDGYDIADYYNVHPYYGELRDVRSFVREAHRRNLRVVTELVVNHTSDQHPWFQRAQRARPGSPERDFYVWSDSPDRYREARIIFKDFENSNWTWDPVANAYYWHRFYSHQPDLNYDSPRVRQAIFKVTDFWLRMGIDGLRLDAVPYLFEREGTNCENLPQTHAFLRELRDHVDAHYPNRMLLAEANQWPEDSAAYFGSGDECHMAFHFPVMPRLFMSIQMEDRFPIVDILEQTPAIPDNSQWALFLRNHDELTLEMVTDEERDYMYRVYAHEVRARINLGIRRRLAPLLSNNRRRIELMNALLFALPGTPVIYYGDEIGMGDNIYLGDRNAVRTPMQWSPDRNAGFSSAGSQQLYLPVITESEYYYAAVNVEAQQRNPQSLLWWMKRLIDLRKRHRAFGRGQLEFLHPDNRHALAFLRRYAGSTVDEKDELILVVANLSRFSQPVELDLSACQGLVPWEMFGGVEFPTIGEAPYKITLSPHAFFWLKLESPRQPLEIAQGGEAGGSALPVPASLRASPTASRLSEEIRQGAETVALSQLLDALPAYLQRSTWFRGRARRIERLHAADLISLNELMRSPQRHGHDELSLLLTLVSYSGGEAELYNLPLALVGAEEAGQVLLTNPAAGIGRVQTAAESQPGPLLCDGLASEQYCATLVGAISGQKRLRGLHGELQTWATPGLRSKLALVTQDICAGSADQGDTNSSQVTFGQQVTLKLLRRVEAGVHPELEMKRFLTQRAYADTPALLGAATYYPERGELILLATVEEYLPNQGTAWQLTLDSLAQYFENALTLEPPVQATPPLTARTLLAQASQAAPEGIEQIIGPYLQTAHTLGERTAGLHLALAADDANPTFAPEAFTGLFQRSIYQSVRSGAVQLMQHLRRYRRRQSDEAGEPTTASIDRLLAAETAFYERLRAITDHRLSAARIRIHGNYTLHQLLYTGRDFAITNFGGDPARPPSENRIKRSPLRDIASLMLSFYAAAQAVLHRQAGTGLIRPEDVPTLHPWARLWLAHNGAAFLRAYLADSAPANLLPHDSPDLATLLSVLVAERLIVGAGRNLEENPAALQFTLRALLEWLDLP